MSPNVGNVFVQDVVDRGPWIFWDRQTSAAGGNTSTPYTFFTTPIGGSKTKSDTNLKKGNQLPPPQAFSLSSIGFVFASTMLPADLATFLKNYYFEFTIGSKVFAEGPLHLWPGGAGISGFASTNHATTALVQTVNVGVPDLNACRRFPDYPRIIPANVFFGLNVIGTVFALVATVASTIVSPAYGGLDCMSILDGVYDREVQ
jgi:hypothetical protein